MVELLTRAATLIAIARGAIARKAGPPAGHAWDDPWLRETGASFVTLRLDGDLRGCVGSVDAHRPLGDDVAHNAFAAAYRAGRGLMPEDMLTALRRAGADLVSGLDERPAGLTYRELEVLDLVADGLSNGEIALRLVVSPRTVHAHLRSIFGKLGVTTRTAAAHQAGRLSRT